jgi:hypothetical protein
MLEDNIRRVDEEVISLINLIVEKNHTSKNRELLSTLIRLHIEINKSNKNNMNGTITLYDRTVEIAKVNKVNCIYNVNDYVLMRIDGAMIGAIIIERMLEQGLMVVELLNYKNPNGEDAEMVPSGITYEVLYDEVIPVWRSRPEDGSIYMPD